MVTSQFRCGTSLLVLGAALLQACSSSDNAKSRSSTTAATTTTHVVVITSAPATTSSVPATTSTGVVSTTIETTNTMAATTTTPSTAPPITRANPPTTKPKSVCKNLHVSWDFEQGSQSDDSSIEVDGHRDFGGVGSWYVFRVTGAQKRYLVSGLLKTVRGGTIAITYGPGVPPGGPYPNLLVVDELLRVDATFSTCP